VRKPIGNRGELVGDVHRMSGEKFITPLAAQDVRHLTVGRLAQQPGADLDAEIAEWLVHG
jgi:hypothetical protein